MLYCHGNCNTIIEKQNEDSQRIIKINTIYNFYFLQKNLFNHKMLLHTKITTKYQEQIYTGRGPVNKQNKKVMQVLFK